MVASRRLAQNVRAVPAKVAQSPQPAATQRTSFSADTRTQLDTKQNCPLCIEELDETDREFFPCPCGYQVCLFCYGQVKEKCNSQCPGCRREYGDPLDAQQSKQQAAQRAAVGGTSQLHTTRAAAAAAAAAALAAPKHRGHDASGSMRGVDDTAALPTGATWATHAATRQPPPAHATPAPPRVPPPVDQSAWPSLSDSSASTLRRPARQEPPTLTNLAHMAEAGSDSDTSHCRSYSPSSADLTPLDSHCSSSQDLMHDQAAAAALGTHVAIGSQRPPDSLARGAAGRSLLAAGKAPPGFGGMMLHAAAAPSTSSFPTHQDPSVAGPPLGKFQPIQPPPQHAPQRQEPHSGYYSLWSGLPGIELNLSQTFGGVHGPGGYPCSLPLGANQAGNCFNTRPPPPGFGPAPYAPPAEYGAPRMYPSYQMFGAAPGGGQFAGMAHPSGMAV